MSNGNIREEDFLGMTEKMREAYTFRLLMEIRDEVKENSKIRLGCQTVASFIGGVVGGAAAIFGAGKLKILG